MNILLSCIGKRGYIADFLRPHIGTSGRLIGTGNTLWTPGFISCDRGVVLPSIEDPAYVPALLELCREEQITGLLSFNDLDVFVLSQHTAAFAAIGVTPLLPSARTAAVTFDKLETFKVLSAAGIPTPASSLSLDDVATFGFPVVVKPRRGSASRNTIIARTESEARTAFGLEPDMLIQQFVKGEEFDIELCGDKCGRPIGFSAWRKFQSRMGETEHAETFHDPEVFALGMRLAELMPVPGPMDIDLIRHPGGITVLEFNPRFGGGYPVSHLAGADFARLIVETLRGATVTPFFGYRAGVVMMKRLEIIGGPTAELEAHLHGSAPRG